MDQDCDSVNVSIKRSC